MPEQEEFKSLCGLLSKISKRAGELSETKLTELRKLGRDLRLAEGGNSTRAQLIDHIIYYEFR